MDVIHHQASGNSHTRHGAGQMRVAPDMAVQAGFMALEERDHVAQLGLFQLDVECDGAVGGTPFAARRKPSEAAGGPVGSRGLRAQRESPGTIGTRGRPQVDIGAE